MLQASGEMLDRGKGVIELELPMEAIEILWNIRKDIENITPTEERDGEAVLFSYDIGESCRKLSYAIASQKAQDIKAVLSMAQLKPATPMRTPRIFGSDRGGFRTPSGFVGVSVLISDTIEAELISSTGRVPRKWNQGKITLFMENTALMLRDSEGVDEEESVRGSDSKALRPRVVYFYFSIPVERQG